MCAAPSRGCTNSCRADATASRRSAAPTRPPLRDTYDLDGNGTFETCSTRRPRAAAVSSLQFDPDMPAVHRRVHPRLPASVPGPGQRRRGRHLPKIHNMFAQVDINGILPDGPNQPFGGFGRVDPNQGIVYRVTTTDWTRCTTRRCRSR